MVHFTKSIRAALLLQALVVVPVTSLSGLVLEAGPAAAAVVREIAVRGNSRMDADTVRSYLTITPGQPYEQSDIDDSVRALYGTGLFTDVSISQSGNTLVVAVSESGVVNAVYFEGNNRIKDPALAAAVQTAARSAYSPAKVEEDVQRIREAYSRVGRADASVTYEVVPLANNRVNVIFRVNEGDKAKISAVEFVGNQAYPTRRLRDVVGIKATNLLSFLRNDDIYDADRVRADEDRLRRFYYSRGYADFQVLSTDVSFDDASNQYVITFNVEEGALYTFGNVTVDSTVTGLDGAELGYLVETNSGELYNAKNIEDTVIAISEAAAARGFPFVQVVPRGNRNFATNTIDVAYQIDQGQRYYIETINITGNDRTRDYVIRREFDVAEGDALNQVEIQKTKRRLEGLGFFESVDIATRPGSAPDQVVLVVRLVEKSTGEFSVGGGYSTANGPLAEVSISERNFLGRGQYVKIGGSFGDGSRKYQLSFTEPYFLGYRVSAGFDLFASTSEATSRRQYELNSYGGTLRFGVPLTEKLSTQGFYTFQRDETVVSSALLDPPNGNGDGIQGNADNELSAGLLTGQDWTKSGVGYQLTYADLDDPKLPREGYYANFNQTFFGVGGDARYVSTSGTAVAYTLLNEELDLVSMLRARGGANLLYGGTDGYRAQDNFIQGGRDIRGFDSYGFGPRDPATGDAIGGLYYWNATAELTVPFPLLPESAGFRAGVFADVGQLWGVDSQTRSAILAANPGISPEQLDSNPLRASVGASIIWASPFGPLRVDYAVPIARADWDKTRAFSFGVSTAF